MLHTSQSQTILHSPKTGVNQSCFQMCLILILADATRLQLNEELFSRGKSEAFTDTPPSFIFIRFLFLFDSLRKAMQILLCLLM